MDDADEESSGDGAGEASDEPTTWQVDEGWALVVATDQEADAEAVHQRLRAAGLDAYIRDVDAETLEEDQLPIQVIVPVEEAAAAVLELDIALSVASAKGDAGDVDRIAELGYEIDDLAIAELAATGGPVYGLHEFGDDDGEIRDFLRILEIERVRFALDRAANLVVHHNDEVKVDAIINRVFGEEGAADYYGSAERDPNPGPDSAANDESELGEALTHSPSDIDGRPAVDDMTPDATIVPASGPPNWVYALVAVAVVVFAIVLLL